jgi:hypothetical protein
LRLRQPDLPFCVHAKPTAGDTTAVRATINTLKDRGHAAIAATELVGMLLARHLATDTYYQRRLVHSLS